MGGMVEVTYREKCYSIPDIWLAGFCTARGTDDSPRTIMDAIAWWAYQDELRELEEAQDD